MTTDVATEKEPLWLLIEKSILEHASALSGEDKESTIQRIAEELDNAGHNVSHHGGNMLELRWAIDDMLKVGRPLMKDFNEAVEALTLEDVADLYTATVNIISEVGEVWPKLRGSERKPDMLRIMEKTKLDLLIAKAKGLSEEEGIRLLIEEEVDSEVIVEALGITKEKYGEVNAAVEKDLAERERVKTLLKEAGDKSDEDKVKHLFTNNVSDELIIEMAGVEQSVVDTIKQAMEAELAEKKKQEEEEAAKKAAEAAGPSLEDIPADERLEHIEAIREILEFSDVEKEIRTMCEQSSIPKCLVDIAISEPDKLDELEKEAEG
jgi:hypothetical protein